MEGRTDRRTDGRTKKFSSYRVHAASDDRVRIELALFLMRKQTIEPCSKFDLTSSQRRAVSAVPYQSET
jgi:hypothetical protein